MSRLAPLFVLGLAALAGGCATVPTDPDARAEYQEANDPLEPLNRRVFGFNEYLDRALVAPVARGYVRAVPRPGRDAIRNFVSNLNEPVVFANNVLQGQPGRAATTAARFVLDSTLGLAGLVDFAQRRGLQKQTGDFGQTLFAWGLPGGPYLVLPVLGPSCPRDAAGLGVDGYLDPFRSIAHIHHYPAAVAFGPAVLGGIDERALSLDALDAIRRDAVDYYASLRSFYRQNRAAQVRGGEASPTPGQEGFYEDPGASPPEKAPQGAGPLNR